jgi:rhamnose utilization protein RhaD (predicted bifunctional aldolase and dehydrogenase)
MSVIWDPSLVSEELVRLTRSLGEPSKELAILAEGNTSELLGDGRMVVKTSGANMQNAMAEDFVVVEVRPLLDLMLDPASTQDDLSSTLDAGDHGGKRRRASIETLIHVAVQAIAPIRFIGHSHPTDVVALMASIHAETAYDHAAYSDEAVVIGKPLYVPYAQPGIALGRIFHTLLGAEYARSGELPSLVTLGNHGIVALAETSEAIEGISAMAVKSARVRLGAYAAGGVHHVPDESVASFFARADIAERRDRLAGRTD